MSIPVPTIIASYVSTSSKKVANAGGMFEQNRILAWGARVKPIFRYLDHYLGDLYLDPDLGLGDVCVPIEKGPSSSLWSSLCRRK